MRKKKRYVTSSGIVRGYWKSSWNFPPEADFPEDFSKEDVEEYGWEWLEDTYGSIIEGFKIKFDDGRIVEKGVIAGVPYKAK